MSGTFNSQEHHIDSIKNGSGAISGLTKLLIDFGVDDAGGNEIPEAIKNEFIKGSLITAIQFMAESIDYHVEELDRLLESNKPS